MACWLEQVPFSFWLPFGSCLCEFAWCGFSLIFISIYYLRNHLFHFILTMALPVGLKLKLPTNFIKIWCFISYLLPYDLSCEDDLGYLYSSGKYFLILIVLGQLIFTLVVEYFWSSSYWLFVLNCLIYCQDIYFDSRCLPCLLHGSYFSIGIV